MKYIDLKKYKNKRMPAEQNPILDNEIQKMRDEYLNAVASIPPREEGVVIVDEMETLRGQTITAAYIDEFATRQSYPLDNNSTDASI